MKVRCVYWETCNKDCNHRTVHEKGHSCGVACLDNKRDSACEEILSIEERIERLEDISTCRDHMQLNIVRKLQRKIEQHEEAMALKDDEVSQLRCDLIKLREGIGDILDNWDEVRDGNVHNILNDLEKLISVP